MSRPKSSPAQVDAYRIREKERHRKRRTDSSINNEVNERRRERDSRNRAHARDRELQIIVEVFGAGSHVASIVNDQYLVYDLTRWAGPGKLQEARLSEAAGKFLRAAARRKKSKPPLSL